MRVVIVDYNMGNVKSIISALKFIGVDNIQVSNARAVLEKAEKLILPGVGSFAHAIENIKKKQLDCVLNELVLEKKKPILGICLGMQLMGVSSTENGDSLGLGYINGFVTKLNEQHVKIPHVGFNQVIVDDSSRLYQGMSGNIDFYFTHSYRMNSHENINQCFCEYSEPFIASYEVDNIAGVQFHPELSQYNGLRLIKNFIEQF
jgi:glutamine amidotransferase